MRLIREFGLRGTSIAEGRVVTVDCDRDAGNHVFDPVNQVHLVESRVSTNILEVRICVLQKRNSVDRFTLGLGGDQTPVTRLSC